MMKVIVAFRNFANAPEDGHTSSRVYSSGARK
jgi:hypothetical protein